MSKSRPQDIELPADALGRVSAGGDSDAPFADTHPMGSDDTRPMGLDDTRPIGLGDSLGAEVPSGFHVRVAAPRVQAPETAPIIAPIVSRGRPAGDGPQPKRVLVVDDDATTRLYLRSKLMLRGHVFLLEAANGAQAMEYLITQRFDAVLLDVDMGEQNGFEVCRAIRSHIRSIRGKQPRIYIITSRSGVLDKMRAKMAGADAFLSKPPHPSELAELLAQL